MAVAGGVIDATGAGLIVTDAEVAAEQLLASVTVTSYVPAEDGETLIAAVASPVLHR